MSTQAALLPAPGAPAPRPVLRHALGLPAGSVRALLAFAVLLYLWVMALKPHHFSQPHALAAFVYLQLVMILVLCHFLVAHGKTIGSAVSPHSPLWMPRGSVRFVLLAGYFGLAYWMWNRWGELSEESLQINSTEVLLVAGIVAAAFVAGHVSTNAMLWVNGNRLPAWFLDVQAWFGLIALFLLAWVLIVRLVINPGMSDQAQLSLKYTEPAMAAFATFYFGARS